MEGTPIGGCGEESEELGCWSGWGESTLACPDMDAGVPELWRRSQLIEWHPESLSRLPPAGELWGSEKLLVFASPRFVFLSEMPNIF